jgi:Arc/MetJ-type ribon-helix-helix transcriptional regulator
MTRISVSLSDELSGWIEDRASSRNVSKAQVIRDAVELAKASDAAKGDDISVVQSGVIDRLDELEARVAELESQGSQSPGTDAAESVAAPVEQNSTASSPSDSNDPSAASSAAHLGVSDTVASAVEGVAEGWEDAPDRLRVRKKAAAKILEYAFDSGEPVGKSSEIVEKVREEYPVEGQNAETYYRKNIRPVLKEYGNYSQGHHGYIVSDDWNAQIDGLGENSPELSDE